MKDSKEFSKKIQGHYKDLKKKHKKLDQKVYDEPVEALVYGILSEKLTLAETDEAIKKFDGYFIDHNDLRVSRAEEIVEMIGIDNAETRSIAVSLTTILGHVFESTNTMSLEEIKQLGKKQARQEIEKLPQISPYVVDFCTLTSLQGHAIPLTERMINHLKENELVHPESDHKDIAGFLSRQITADKAFEFYSLLRQASENGDCSGKSKKVVKKTAKKAVKKKKTAKKKAAKTSKTKK